MTTLYRHILVPVDFSPKNQAAIEVAHALSERDRARLTLAHVVHEIEGTENDEFLPFYDLLLRKAAPKLDHYSSKLRESGTDVVQYLVVGKPLVELVRFVEESNVDLIVLSSHRVEVHQPRHDWNTLSYQLSVVLPCQVLLVK